MILSLRTSFFSMALIKKKTRVACVFSSYFGKKKTSTRKYFPPCHQSSHKNHHNALLCSWSEFFAFNGILEFALPPASNCFGGINVTGC